ncbi:MAG: hypothetical protein EXS69_02150, partial [Candidatus Zambryskibacteria bacterium]|nr:hypothetical protein [Candidatus Zambryskibacteria bacterium]
YEKEHSSWLNRDGVYSDYIQAIVKVFIKYIKGVPQEKVLDAAKAVTEHRQNHVYRYTRELTKKLKSKGYYLLAISHSPKFILDGFGQALGFDKIYGIRYELDGKGRFTGKLMDEELILDKARVLTRAVEKEGLTLKNSYGIGDTESDIKFLKMVDNPICFNPNSNLYKEAKRCKWKVVVERKDVIYEI